MSPEKIAIAVRGHDRGDRRHRRHEEGDRHEQRRGHASRSGPGMQPTNRPNSAEREDHRQHVRDRRPARTPAPYASRAWSTRATGEHAPGQRHAQQLVEDQVDHHRHDDAPAASASQRRTRSVAEQSEQSMIAPQTRKPSCSDGEDVEDEPPTMTREVAAGGAATRAMRRSRPAARLARSRQPRQISASEQHRRAGSAIRPGNAAGRCSGPGSSGKPWMVTRTAIDSARKQRRAARVVELHRYFASSDRLHRRAQVGVRRLAMNFAAACRVGPDRRRSPASP